MTTTPRQEVLPRITIGLRNYRGPNSFKEPAVTGWFGDETFPEIEDQTYLSKSEHEQKLSEIREWIEAIGCECRSKFTCKRCEALEIAR